MLLVLISFNNMFNSLLYTLLSKKPISAFTFDVKGKGFDQGIWHDPSNVFFTFDDLQKALDISVWSKYIPKASLNKKTITMKANKKS